MTTFVLILRLLVVVFFCFVLLSRYTKHSDTLMAITCLDGTALDERIIKVGIDPGFKQGRQYGRGMSGGQVGGQIDLLCFVHRGHGRLNVSCRGSRPVVQNGLLGLALIPKQRCFREGHEVRRRFGVVLCCLPGTSLKQ